MIGTKILIFSCVGITWSALLPVRMERVLSGTWAVIRANKWLWPTPFSSQDSKRSIIEIKSFDIS